MSPCRMPSQPDLSWTVATSCGKRSQEVWTAIRKGMKSPGAHVGADFKQEATRSTTPTLLLALWAHVDGPCVLRAERLPHNWAGPGRLLLSWIPPLEWKSQQNTALRWALPWSRPRVFLVKDLILWWDNWPLHKNSRQLFMTEKSPVKQ